MPTRVGGGANGAGVVTKPTEGYLWTFTGGVGQWLDGSAGFVTIATAQTISGAKTLSAITTISNTTGTTSTADGALVIAGGVGVAGAINVGSGLNVAGQLKITGAAPVPIMDCTAASDPTTLTYFSFRRNTVEKGYFGFGDGASGIMRVSNSIGEILLTASDVRVTAGGFIVDAGGITSKDATLGIGYATGAGGTVTQATSKSTGVTLNKVCGAITMNAAALLATTSVGFTLTNSAIAASDVVVVAIKSGATADSYELAVDATAAGSCRISLRNVSLGSLSEAVVLSFIVIKAVTA
jgi:hypothetical protein